MPGTGTEEPLGAAICNAIVSKASKAGTLPTLPKRHVPQLWHAVALRADCVAEMIPRTSELLQCYTITIHYYNCRFEATLAQRTLKKMPAHRCRCSSARHFAWMCDGCRKFRCGPCPFYVVWICHKLPIRHLPTCLNSAVADRMQTIFWTKWMQWLLLILLCHQPLLGGCLCWISFSCH